MKQLPALCDSYEFRGVTLRNRTVMAPMCVWMGELGVETEWPPSYVQGGL